MMETQHELLNQQLLDEIMKSFGESLKSTVGDLTARQNIIEERTNSSLQVLREQLDSLHDSIINYVHNRNLLQSTEKSGTVDVDILSHTYPTGIETLSHAIYCHVCCKAFSALSDLDNHIQENHPNLKCRICSKILRSIPDLNLHNHRHHIPVQAHDPDDPGPCEDWADPCNDQVQSCSQQPAPRSVCDLCGHTFQDESALSNHLAINHSDCYLTSVFSAPDPPSVAHVVNEHDFDICTCYICENTFGSWGLLYSHINDHYPTPISMTARKMLTNNNRDQRCRSPPVTDIHEQTTMLRSPPQPHTPSYYSCSICKTITPSFELLEQHLLTEHGISRPESCDQCEKIFLNRSELNRHVGEDHIGESSDPVSLCDHCDDTFHDAELLSPHITPNQMLTSIPPTSNNSFPSLSTPVCCSSEGSLSPITSHSVIPQLDGVLDTTISSISDSHSFNIQSEPSSDRTTLQTSYVLNQQRQIQGLLRNTMRKDFVLEINDNGRNVSIECSVGFYEAVAKPSFSTISCGFSHQAYGVNISCTEARESRDQASRVPALFVRFVLAGPDVQPDHAPLTVHLHHTQAKLQIQGGALMPDNNTAAIWFVKNLLKDRFVNEAKTKKYDISNINTQVSAILSSARMQSSSARMQSPSDGMQSSLSNSCAHCNKKFANNSRPIRCYRCSKLKHKTKCSGVCPATMLPSSFDSSPVISSPGVSAPTTQPSFASNKAPYPMVSLSFSNASMPAAKTITSAAIPEGPRVASGDTFSPPASSPRPKRPRPAAPATFQPLSSTQVPSTVPFTIPITTLSSTPSQTSAPTLTLTTSQQRLSSLSFPPCSRASIPASSQTRKRKDTQDAVSSQEKAEIKFLTIELNSVRAQVLELESANTDLVRKVKIMEDLIKSYEGRETAKAYEELRPAPPGQQPAYSKCPCRSSPPPCHYLEHFHTCISCAASQSSRSPPHCPKPCPPVSSCPTNHCDSCAVTKPANAQHNDAMATSLNNLKNKVDRMEHDLIDIVNLVETKTSTSNSDDNTSNSVKKRKLSQSRPTFRNPGDIPGYDSIEVIEVAEIHAADESVTSVDEFVGESEATHPHDPSLNSNLLTTHLL